MKTAQQASVGLMSCDMLDASAWRCLLSGLAREGLNEEATVVMREMMGEGIRIDKVKHNLPYDT